MKNKALILLSLLIMTLLSGFVVAEIQVEQYSSDFSINPVNLNPFVCLCSDFNDEILLKNNAPYPQVFEVSSNYSHASIGVKQLTLEPNSEMIIPILVSAPCSMDAGVVPYSVFIKSTTGEEEVFTRNLDVRECQTIESTLYTNKNSSNICESVNYSLKLRNPSTLKETYKIGPTRSVEFFNVKGYNVTLEPNQVSVLNFTFTPSCDVSGNVKNEFRIDALTSDLTAKVNHDLFIEPGYNFSVAGSEDLSLCRLENESVEYTITNNGLINNTYDLSIKNNPDFVSLSEDVVSLSPNESANVDLVFAPGAKAKDDYDFSLLAKARIGDVESAKQINLSLNDCYDASLSILNPRSLTVCEGEESLKVSLENLGSSIETFNLVSDDSRTGLSAGELTLEPNSSEVFNLSVDTTNLEGKHSFDVSAHSTKNLLTHWSDSITLDVMSSDECAQIKFPARKVYSRFYEDNVSLTIKNVGIKDESYNVSYFGDDFLQLDDESLFIPAGEEATLTLNKTKEHTRDEYFFSLNLTSSSNQTYSKEFKLVLTGTPFLEQVKEYAILNPCFLFTLILLVVSFLFLLSLLLFGSVFSKNVRLIISFALVILLLFALFIYGLPGKVNPSLVQPEDPYSFKMYQGNSLTLDLNDYIVDPDNGTLSFKVLDEPSNISLVQDNNTLHITSDNFAGVDRFRVLAEDEAGADVVTPRFNVEVVERVSLSLKELYEFYCPHLNMALLLLLVVFVFLSGNRKSVKKPLKQKSKKTSTGKTVKKTTIPSKKSAKKTYNKKSIGVSNSSKKSAKKTTTKKKKSKK